MPGSKIPARAVFLLPGGFALLAGLDAALVLLDLPAPVRTTNLTETHGVLLVLGFVGTLVALERAVAAGKPLGYLAPAALGLGALLLVSPAPRTVAGGLLLLGTAALLALYLPLWRRSADMAVMIQAGGAVLATGAALLWLAGIPVPELIPWLAGFLILTIAGERLELARVIALNLRTEATLAAMAAAFVASTLATLLWPTAGYPALGASLLAMTGWLAWHDIARRTVHATALPRYMAVCLLAGYGWLLVPAVLWLLTGAVTEGRAYDAIVHAVMLGFVMSMIMAHAPVILPAVLRRPLPYRPAMYVGVVLLHVSLLLRIAIGDARNLQGAIQVGGVLNIIAILAFIAVAAYSAIRHRTPERPKVAA